MNDVAAEAGVARATGLPILPNGQALLDELARVAVEDADARLGTARIDEVAPEEGIARAVRALVDVGGFVRAPGSGGVRSDPHHFERRLAVPLRRLFNRVRPEECSRDISGRLTESLIQLMVGVLCPRRPSGKEDMIAAIRGLFLDGARAGGPTPNDRTDQHMRPRRGAARWMRSPMSGRGDESGQTRGRRNSERPQLSFSGLVAYLRDTATELRESGPAASAGPSYLG